MLGYNKITLLGNLTAKPETQPVGQTVVSNVTIAINERNSNGEDVATFVELAFWGKQAEILAQYADKGTPIMVDGKLNVSKWEKDGQTRVKYRVNVTDFRFVGLKANKNGSGDNGVQRPNNSYYQTSSSHGYSNTEEIPF